VESFSRAGGVADVIQQEPHGSLVYNLGEDLTTANQRSNGSRPRLHLGTLSVNSHPEFKRVS
jgi:hypothetical protein